MTVKRNMCLLPINLWPMTTSPKKRIEEGEHEEIQQYNNKSIEKIMKLKL